MTSPYGHTQTQSVGSSVTARLLEPLTLYARASSTANLSDLTAVSATQDGVSLSAGDILLVPEQSDASENGLYVYGSGGVLTRHAMMAEDAEAIPGTIVYVSEGTGRGNKYYRLTSNAPLTIGTSNLVFTGDPAGANITIADAGSFTSQTDVEGALQEIYQHLKSVQWQVNVSLGTGILAAGTPLAAFADNASSNPGITLADSKAVAVRWNNNATQTAVWYSVPMPQLLDDAAAIVMHVLASKSGATLADATTFTVTAFFQTVGALHDADADCGGTSSALVGDATAKMVSELTLSIAAGDVPPAPCNLSFSIKPTDGTLGTDDAIVEAIWFELKPKLLTS